MKYRLKDGVKVLIEPPTLPEGSQPPAPAEDKDEQPKPAPRKGKAKRGEK